MNEFLKKIISNTAVNFSGVVANILDFDILVSEFEFQMRYYVHFRNDTLEEGFSLLILPTIG